MSYYTLNIDDEKVREQMNGIIDTIFKQELDSRYSGTGHIISQAVKDIVYSHKDEIINKVVDRAAKEIIRKSLPKLLEKYSSSEV